MTGDKHPFHQALILTGPTGSGKSGLALELAEQLDGELIGMDSMTLYRRMDIGTAKPSAADLARVPHHLIDRLEPWEAGNVAWWLAEAEQACRQIRTGGKIPIFVGGTPLYLKALLHGLVAGPPMHPEIRQQWEAFAQQEGPERLHAKLGEVDAVTAARLHVNDVRRVVRALEIWSLTGQPMSAQPANWEQEPRRIPAVVLDWPRPVLYQRIEQRVSQMLRAGWLEEVKLLRELSPPISKEAGQALGYRELFQYLAGGITWEETVSRLVIHTRQFAKRQLTWFRGIPALEWCPVHNAPCADTVLRLWQKS